MSSEQENLDESKQPLLQHLVELRGRLVKSLILIAALFVVSYIFADTIYNFLVQPYADAVEGEEGRRLIFTALHETFFTYLKVALFTSLFISLPFILIQIWIFVAPGLYKNEKTVVLITGTGLKTIEAVRDSITMDTIEPNINSFDDIVTKK